MFETRHFGRDAEIEAMNGNQSVVQVLVSQDLPARMGIAAHCVGLVPYNLNLSNLSVSPGLIKSGNTPASSNPCRR